MNRTKRFFKNTITLVVANLLQPTLSLLLVVAISRLMGIQGLGEYTTVMKYMAVFQVAASFGLRNLLTREIAKDPADTQTFLVSGGAVALLSAVFFSILMVVVVSLVGSDETVIWGGRIAAVSLIAAALIDVYEGVIAGHERLSQIGYASVIETVFRVVFSLGIIFSGGGIYLLVGVHVFARYLKAVYYFIYIKRHFARPVGPLVFEHVVGLIRQSWVFALIMVCVIVYWNADGIMLKALRSTEEAGYYGAAYRFFLPGLVVVDSFVNSLFPVISNLHKSSESEFMTVCFRALRALVLVTIPVAVALSVEADKIIPFLYGESAMPAVAVLQLLIWCLLPYAVSQVLAYTLLASGRQKYDLMVNASAMVANILLNLILIPIFGYMGATVATLLSIVFYVVLQIPYFVRNGIKLSKQSFLGQSFRVILAAGAMAFFLHYARDLNFMISIPLAFMVYGFGLIILQIIQREDWQLVMRFRHN